MGESVRRWVGVLVLAGVLAASGCGGADAGGSGGGGDAQPVVVSAAASLTEALTACQDQVDGVDPRLSFAGSDELAAQIRQGVKPDVYLAANTTLPDELAKAGLLGKPVQFATNDLVIAVPVDSSIDSIKDLTQPGVTLVIGSESVPFGDYTRTVLSHLPRDESQAIFDNVRSTEPDVKGAVGKLVQGAADAAFTYNTDVTATDGKLKAVELPAELQPSVAYGGGVVDGAPHPEAARRYLESVRSGACKQALTKAGFGAPPAS